MMCVILCRCLYALLSDRFDCRFVPQYRYKEIGDMELKLFLLVPVPGQASATNNVDHAVRPPTILFSWVVVLRVQCTAFLHDRWHGRGAAAEWSVDSCKGERSASAGKVRCREACGDRGVLKEVARDRLGTCIVCSSFGHLLVSHIAVISILLRSYR